MRSLLEALRWYSQSDFYPFHMPGHKRRMGSLPDPFFFDLTEIEGFDNLHRAQGILKEAQERAAELFGAQETHFLVNGSTGGILSAIGACAPEGKLLLARNSHSSAYHAVSLNRLEAVYVYPRPFLRNGVECAGEVNGPVTAQDVEEALQIHPDAKAVFITSPTYDGVVSETEKIAEAAHGHGIPLIVDEAHGAHFGLHPFFPETALRLGADLVIQSLHKTLPSLTQTALLHVNGDLVDRVRLRKLLGVYQSSSPSYVLMASIDQCVELLSKQGEDLFAAFADHLKSFYGKMNELVCLRIWRTDDPSKILIAVPEALCREAAWQKDGAGKKGSLASCPRSGLELERFLREHDRLQMEMAGKSYALALSSVGDSEEGFLRLANALLNLDQIYARTFQNGRGSGVRTESLEEKEGEFDWSRGRRIPESCMPIFQAENSRTHAVRLEQSAGYISGEYLYLYPPGVPLITPGERIDAGLLEEILSYRRFGYTLHGLADESVRRIRVL